VPCVFSVAFVAIEAFTRFHPVVDSQSSKTVSVTTTFSAAEPSVLVVVSSDAAQPLTE
jgi:hypothetical protein